MNWLKKSTLSAVALVSIFAAGNLMAAPGAWKQVGKAGAWKATMVGTVLNNKIYTVESSGTLYETNPGNGKWKQIGKPEFASTRFIFAAQGSLFTIEKSGNLYKVNPANGTWKQVGKAGAWKATMAGTVLKDKIYTVETSGSLYQTDPATGKWKQQGKAEFGKTRFLFAGGDSLFSIEKDGSLYKINPGNGKWKQVGKSGAWKATIRGTTLANQLYTVESSGVLYRTNTGNGKWVQLGKAEFGSTRFLFGTNKKLYSIEKSGNLYAIEVK